MYIYADEQIGKVTGIEEIFSTLTKHSFFLLGTID